MKKILKIKFYLNKIELLTLAKLYLNGADGYFFSGQTFESIEYYNKAGHYALIANFIVKIRCLLVYNQNQKKYPT